MFFHQNTVNNGSRCRSRMLSFQMTLIQQGIPLKLLTEFEHGLKWLEKVTEQSMTRGWKCSTNHAAFLFFSKVRISSCGGSLLIPFRSHRFKELNIKSSLFSVSSSPPNPSSGAHLTPAGMWREYSGIIWECQSDHHSVVTRQREETPKRQSSHQLEPGNSRSTPLYPQFHPVNTCSSNSISPLTTKCPSTFYLIPTMSIMMDW